MIHNGQPYHLSFLQTPSEAEHDKEPIDIAKLSSAYQYNCRVFIQLNDSTTGFDGNLISQISITFQDSTKVAVVRYMEEV